MGHTVTGKLNKAANQFQAGESAGFGIRIGVKAYNRETQQDEWTNYEAAIFSKQQNQIQFYQNALVEGAIVSINCETLTIKRYQGNLGESLSLGMNNARLEYVNNPNQQPMNQGGYQQPQQQMQSQGGYQQPQQRAQAPHDHPQNRQPQQAPQGGNMMNDFDDDVPFSNYELKGYWI